MSRHPFLSPVVTVLGRHGITATEVARQTGVSRQAVSQWLNGSAQPRPELFEVVTRLAGAEASAEVKRAIDVIRSGVEQARGTAYAGL